jgi:hypothetical protein
MSVITLCNWGYRQLARNLNMSLRRIGEAPATIYVPDKITLAYLEARGEPCILLADSHTPRTAGVFMDADFIRIVQFKLRVLGAALAGAAGPIFFVDPDVVFLNPYSEALAKIPLDADFTAQLNPNGTICMGVVIIRPGAKTRSIFPVDPDPAVDNDETYANRMIAEVGCAVRSLDGDLWVVGANAFRPSCICHHFNFRYGMETKISDMRDAGCWFADYEPTVFSDNWFTQAEDLSAIEGLIKKHGVQSVLEIGINRGETAKKLLDACPGIKRYTGIDITGDATQNMPPHQREQRKRAGSMVADVARSDRRLDVFVSPNGSKDFKTTYTYDLVFIDGNHAYDWVKHDTELARRLNARVIAWHDYGTEPGVTRAVGEVGRNVTVVQNTRLAYEIRK